MEWKETVTFGGSGLDRAAELRADKQAIDALARTQGTRFVVFWRGKPALYADARLACVSPGADILTDASEPAVFLGRDEAGAVFAVTLDRWDPDDKPDSLDAFIDTSLQRHPGLPENAGFTELRTVLGGLDPRGAELLATAKAVLGWHRSHRFCARCGTQSQMAEAGWQRQCPACGARHFPRTDPVVIMLILRANRVLVGRSPGWPEGMYSLLAGFVEPGETLEAAVRREVFEEAGVQVGRVDYLVSQPWPFPSSLMFGCIGHATTTELTIDPLEIDDARWVNREDMAEVLRGTHADMNPPRQGAVARFLIEGWLQGRAEVDR
ncbi:MAG: NAD(+) diphosphatase [Pseudomonadota bacterium]